MSSAENNRQILVVDNALVDSRDKTTRLLVESLARPARVQPVHFRLELVVKSPENRLKRNERRLLVESIVA